VTTAGPEGSSVPELASVPPARPFGVTLLAIIGGVGGVVGIALSVIALSAGFGLALISLVLASIDLAFGVGAWRLRPWAWPLGVVIWSLSLLDALLQFSAGQLNTNLVVAPLCLYYLSRGEVRAAFRG
jgi:hypothetical protein